MEFDKNEKKEIRETLGVALKDLRKIYDASSSDEVKVTFRLPCDYGSDYNLCINKSQICFCCQDDRNKYVLEKRNSLIHKPEISDYETIYDLLARYDDIRKMVETRALESSQEKKLALKKLKELRDKYSTESTVELDLAETNNIRTVDIREENGTTISEIRFGRDTIRLITKGTVVVNDSRTKEKVKGINNGQFKI